MLVWRPTRKIAIDLLGGVALKGNLRLEDKDGGYISEDFHDAAPFVGLDARIAF